MKFRKYFDWRFQYFYYLILVFKNNIIVRVKDQHLYVIKEVLKIILL